MGDIRRKYKLLSGTIRAMRNERNTGQLTYYGIVTIVGENADLRKYAMSTMCGYVCFRQACDMLGKTISYRGYEEHCRNLIELKFLSACYASSRGL